MFKKFMILTVFIALAGILIFGAVYRTQARGGSRSEGSPGIGSGYRGGSNNGANVVAGEQTNLPAADPSGLSPAEAEAMTYMREEEKLAHDIYLTLYDQWDLAISQNIVASEQTHMTAELALLDRYGPADPASSQVGVFTNPDLQVLYDQLIARGGQSLAEALEVGGLIEEVDILDLQIRLIQTDNLDIEQVFKNLMNGSTNHLRAFASTYNSQTGETYQPQALSLADYQAILSSRGSGSGNGQGGGGHGISSRGGRGRRNGQP